VTYAEYGILIYDLVRHIADRNEVKEDAVWAWVLLERREPLSDPIVVHDLRK